jgi:L-fucose mutarotase/ribose pyranase (RbsD/FucU family)
VLFWHALSEEDHILKGIPPDIISPDFLKILHEMGHGDDLVIGDANFPAATTEKKLYGCMIIKKGVIR